jgi:hypothetical protein
LSSLSLAGRQVFLLTWGGPGDLLLPFLQVLVFTYFDVARRRREEVLHCGQLGV